MSHYSPKFCRNCGNQLDDNTKFCPNCGQQVVEQTVHPVQNIGLTQPTPVGPAKPMMVEDSYLPVSGQHAYQVFNIDQLAKGVWHLLRGTYKEGLTLYLPYILVISVVAFIIAESIIAFIYSFPFMDDLFFIELRDLFSVALFTSISGMVIGLFRPLVDIPYYRRIDNHEAGRYESWGESFSFAIGKLINVIVTQIMLFVITFGIMVVCFVAPVLILIFLNDVLGILLMFILGFGGIFLVIYVYIRLSVAVPAVVYLTISPIEALRASWRLSERTMTNIFLGNIGIAIATSIITGAISSVTSPLGIFATPGVGTVFVTILQNLFILPIQTVYLAGLFYFVSLYHKDIAHSPSFFKDIPTY